jgi:class 3 adenylate cyclase
VGDPSSLIEWVGAERATLAIVFTDIVDSTRLGNKIGDAAMDEVREAHFARSDILLAEHGGCQIKTIGDSVMAVFHSAGVAFDYAYSLHLDPGHDELRPRGVRAGIHLGSVQVKPTDIFGAHVAFAARVAHAIADAEIWLSAQSFDDLRTHRATHHETLRWLAHPDITLKGFDDTHTLWSLTTSEAGANWTDIAGRHVPEWIPASEPRPVKTLFVYNLPSLPDRYHERQDEIGAIGAKLLTGGGPVGITAVAPRVGLHGMGGIGKTILATSLVHDPAIHAAFPDGILWLTFGRDVSGPDKALDKAAELARALTQTPPSFTNIGEARGQLGLLTRDMQQLLVLDDVWDPGAVDAFTGLGPDCRVLITTRDNDVLSRAGANRHELGLLDPVEARSFLAEATGIAVEALPPEADAIIRECGRLPLAVSAAGALFREQSYTWSDVLGALQEASLEELDINWLPDPSLRNVAVVLKVSVDLLSEETRVCLFDCAALREDAVIPEATLSRLWSERIPVERRRKRIAQELVNKTLLQRVDDGTGEPRYAIHDLYMDYLRHAAAPQTERHHYLIERYRTVCDSGWDSSPDDGYFVQNLPWHLREAGKKDELRSLLFDPAWMQRKLQVAGPQALIADCQLLAVDREIGRLAAALQLSAHVLGPRPAELKLQLRGRLLPEDGDSIAELLDKLHDATGYPLDPLQYGYLTRPGALLRTVPTGAPVDAVALLPDGKRALSGSEDKTLRLWDLDTGAELRRFSHDDSVGAVALLPNGKRALSGSWDNTLRLWDLDTGAELRRFEGHDRAVLAVALLPDGKRALSGSYDKTLRLWDLDTGAELRRFEGHDGVGAVALLPDGKRALSGSEDKTLPRRPGIR